MKSRFLCASLLRSQAIAAESVGVAITIWRAKVAAFGRPKYEMSPMPEQPKKSKGSHFEQQMPT
jgi:hypothetical protein